MNHNIIKTRGFTIFISTYCPYCQEAIKILDNLNKKTNVSVSVIDFENFPDDKETVLLFLKKHKARYNFNVTHTTRPIIFYNGLFLGGCSELKQLLL